MKHKSICCKTQFEWTHKDKRLQSNLRFLVCSKCKKGGGDIFWDIENKKLEALSIKR